MSGKGIFLRCLKSLVMVVPFLGILCFCPPPLAGANKASIKGIRHNASQDGARVVLDLTGPVKFSRKFASKTGRIVVNINNASIRRDVKRNIKIEEGVLREIHISKFKKTGIKMFVDTENIRDFKVFQLNGPPRLVVDLLGKTKQKKPPPPIEAKKALPQKVDEKEPVLETKNAPAVEEVLAEPNIIVIDAGHGGHDPGAIGKKGLYEKDVTLAVALKLKKLLQASGNRVILTRDKDIYLTLSQRTEIADINNADIFISVHANASPNRQSRGVETYFLNWTDEEESLKVAARENRVSFSKMKEAQSELDTILASLELDAKRWESLRLADDIQKSLVTSLSVKYEDISDLGVKKGPFYVLYTKGIPSVLVEISFISNPEDEKRLRADGYLAKIAEGMAEGIGSFAASIPAEYKVAKR